MACPERILWIDYDGSLNKVEGDQEDMFFLPSFLFCAVSALQLSELGMTALGNAVSGMG